MLENLYSIRPRVEKALVKFGLIELNIETCFDLFLSCYFNHKLLCLNIDT